MPRSSYFISLWILLQPKVDIDQEQELLPLLHQNQNRMYYYLYDNDNEKGKNVLIYVFRLSDLELTIADRELALQKREENQKEREENFKTREETLAAREANFREREEKLSVREQNIAIREQNTLKGSCSDKLEETTPPPDYTVVRFDETSQTYLEIGSTKYCSQYMRFFADPDNETAGACDYHECSRPLLYSDKYKQCFLAWSQVSRSISSE